MTSPQASAHRALLTNSATALVLAALVAVTLHELAHAVAGLAVGLTPVLSTNSVSYRTEGTPGQQALTAAAGPVFSLVSGALILLATRSRGGGFGRLFWLWLSLISMMNFAGYLMIAPFVRVGDTGRVLEILQAPGWVYAIGFVLGTAGMLFLARLLAGQVVRYCREPAQMRSLVLFAWLAGTAIYVVLTLVNLTRADVEGGAYPVIAAGAGSVAIFAPLFTFFYRRLPAGTETLSLRSLPTAGLATTALLALVLFVVVAPGIQFS